MKPENPQWQQIRNDYLAKVEQALAAAPPSERRQILDEVTVHLDRRFAELAPDEQTWEAMQAIIIDMGPAADYAELLEEKSALALPSRRKSTVYWIAACLAVISLLSIIASGSYLLYKKFQTPERPVVIQTSPQTLETAVDPDTTQISVTFNQPMMNLSWSWVGGGEHFPEMTGEPSYDKDRTTCTLPVKLKPGQWYFVGINSEKFVYFQTEKHIPAKPYVILFATADENGNPTQIPEDYIEEAKRVNAK
jgi:hypothetical protein